MLAWFWFGGVSMAWTADTYEYPTSSDGVQSVWDYIHSEESWNAAYNKTPFSALKAYEDINRTEDLYSSESNRVAQITDMICNFTSYADELGNTEYANWTIKWILYGPLVYPTPAKYNEVEVVTNSIDWFVGRHFYLKDDAFDINEIKEGSEDFYELYTSKDPWETANVWVKINSCSYPGFEKSWKAWSPQWAVINLPIPFKGTISVQYNWGGVTYPWGSDVNLFKAWYAIKGVGSYSDFDPTKLTITLIPAYTVTFDINGWESTAEIENQDVLKWETATKPTTEPTKEWCIFMWWYNWENKYEFTEEVTANVELTAKWLDESSIKSFYTSSHYPFNIVLDWTNILEDETLAANKTYGYSKEQLSAVIWWNLANVTAEIVNIEDLWWDVLFVKVVDTDTYTTMWFLSKDTGINYFWTDWSPKVTEELKTNWMDTNNVKWPSWAISLTNYEAYNEVKDAEENLIWYTVRVRENPGTQTDWYIYVPVKKYYTISLWTVSNGTISSDKETAAAWDTVTLTATPNTNYNFTSWTVKNGDADVTVSNNTFTMPAGNVTVTATFTAKSSGSSYSWGGGSSRSSTKTDDTKKAEETTKDTAKVDDKKVDETKTDETKNDTDNEWSDGNKNPTTFSQEFIDAYNFAYKNGITTKESIEEADLFKPLTRIAMAKMLSQYAINVLGQTPDTTVVVPTFPDVDAKLDADYNNWVTLAYQLWIMWIGIQKFRPFDTVTRAEFWTALSRMLYGTADGEWNEWYSTHLQKLMDEKIITNNNPNLKELRGYVMIMLMRSAQ